jgi:hypothetical protein
MLRRFFIAATFACALAVAGCTQSPPVAPSASNASTPTDEGAAPDGSTLKVTAPTAVSPRDGIRIQSVRPSLVIGPSRSNFVTLDGFTYRYELLAPDGQVIWAANTQELQVDVPVNLLTDTRYTWRARAEYEGAFGPFSAPSDFLTIDYQGIVPRPPGGAWPTNGPAVIAYVSESFPELLTPTRTDDERHHNMVFLRDRIIETGLCGGMDLGWNAKRGGPQKSVDAITYRRPDRKLEIIDLAVGFDDKHQWLRLQWAQTFAAFYWAYENHPGC